MMMYPTYIGFDLDFPAYGTNGTPSHKHRPLSRKKKPIRAYQHKKKSVRMAKQSRRKNRK